MTSLPILTISEYIRGQNSHEFLSRELSLASRHFVKSVKITRFVVKYISRTVGKFYSQIYSKTLRHRNELRKTWSTNVCQIVETVRQRHR